MMTDLRFHVSGGGGVMGLLGLRGSVRVVADRVLVVGSYLVKLSGR